jgi:GrpB-like predicted nucleotidyltransferase (UPF0157 family)
LFSIRSSTIDHLLPVGIGNGFEERAEQTDQPERAHPSWLVPVAAVARARLSSPLCCLTRRKALLPRDDQTMIIIHHYNPAWPEEFERLRKALQEILNPLALRIDHIGSTAVPGLGAKDVIDIQVTVRELDPEVTRRLLAGGYQHREAVTHDHVPLGEDATPDLWAKLFFRQPEEQRRANVHVRIESNPNQRYPLLFRDYLRAHPNSARSIEVVKRELAKRHGDDVEAYYDIKDPVYDLIWDAALDWARHTGWEPA